MAPKLEASLLPSVEVTSSMHDTAGPSVLADGVVVPQDTREVSAGPAGKLVGAAVTLGLARLRRARRGVVDVEVLDDEVLVRVLA